MENRNADLSSLRIDRSKRALRPDAGNSKRRLLTIGIPVLVVVIAVVILSLAGMDSPVKVKVVTAELRSPAQSEALMTATGYVIAEQEAAVASKATGRLVYLGVVEGDKVKKGEVIARLQDNDVKAQLAEAKANLEVNKATLADAQWNYNRDKKLLKSGSITESAYHSAEMQYMRAKASVDVAKANVQAASVEVENTLIRAPFDGTVLTKNANVGEIVAPMAGSINARGTVVTIADMKSLDVHADVAESNIELVKPGQDCIITLDAYPNVQYNGYVSKIVPTANRAKATVMVKVAFRKYDSRVLPEMSAKITFLRSSKPPTNTGRSSVLVIPRSAVVNLHDGQVVYRVVSDKAIETPVILGASFGDYVSIESGLVDGDSVVQSPGNKIRNGIVVTPGKGAE